MKLTDIKNGNLSAEWAEKGYELPKFDVEAVKAKTHAEPTWVHFGAGNIFRAFPAAILNDALNSGKYDRGVIVAESFDYEIIDKAYQPYDNLSLLVCLKSTGDIEKKVIASVTESLKADYSFGADWARLVEIFQAPSLQMISFTITEKGYGVAPADLERGLTPVLAMGKVTALLYERFKAGALPLTVQSMDNCSHNGDKVKTAVFAYASKWVEQGLVPAEFLAYVKDETKITFPWSMIDKITPRPDAKVQKMLADDGFEDNYTIVTEKHTFTAPFVNAEETQYLCIEDHYTNGRPPLELGGVLYCDRETVDKIEKMKVCTCLNPLHTAMSIYGCMLGYTLISAEMADEDLRSFIQKIGYIEAMPVVVDPGVLNPYEFIGAVINRRLPNPFMPDAPQRIATDTSQKLAIRFGETIKAYEYSFHVIACVLRRLNGINTLLIRKSKPIKVGISVISLRRSIKVEQCKTIGCPRQSQSHLQFITNTFIIHTIQTVIEQSLKFFVCSTYAYPQFISIKMLYGFDILTVITHHNFASTGFLSYRNIGIRKLEDSESGNIAIFKSGHFHFYRTLATRSLNTLCQCITSIFQCRSLGSIQTHISLTFLQTPSAIIRIMIPLPLQT